jgi:predicted GNAT family acetyltransferase
MKLRIHDSVDDFRSVAVDFYRRDPIAATAELTALRSLTDSDSARLLVTVWDGDKPIGAALQKPPFPLLCGGLPPAAISQIVAELVRRGVHLTGVRGPSVTASTFAAAWCAAIRAVSSVAMNERLYRLQALRPPPGVAGDVRSADPGDIDMIVEWLMLFGQEAFGDTADRAATARSVQASKSLGDEFLLWTLLRQPVSLAVVRLPVAGVSRIGPVYTPTTHRGNGYGAAVTAAAALWAREHSSDDVVLFADLANPTSNTIYQRLGFQPISDYAHIDFTTPA